MQSNTYIYDYINMHIHIIHVVVERFHPPYTGPSLTKYKMQCQRHAACVVATEQVII